MSVYYNNKIIQNFYKNGLNIKYIYYGNTLVFSKTTKVESAQVAFRNIDDVLFVPEYWMSLFEANKKRALPQISLRNIQKKLLDVAPFLIDENIYMKLK